MLVIAVGGGCSTMGKIVGGTVGAVGGAVAGIGCGPGFVICSPLMAGRAAEGGASLGGAVGGWIQDKAVAAATRPQAAEPISSTDASANSTTGPQVAEPLGSTNASATSSEADREPTEDELSAYPDVEGLPSPGASWTYDLKDVMYNRNHAVLRVNVLGTYDHVVEESVLTDFGVVHRAVDASATRFTELPASHGLTLVDFAPYLLAVRGDKPVPGDIKAIGYPLENGEPSWVVRMARVPTWEEIRVPAGKFRALLVEFQGRRERPPFSPLVTQRFSVKVWYAPAVGRYVKLECREWLHSRQSSDVTAELTAFHWQPTTTARSVTK